MNSWSLATTSIVHRRRMQTLALGLLGLLARQRLVPSRAATPSANFFSQFLQPQRSPADEYDPDLTVAPPGLPADYAAIYESAAAGVRAAVSDGVRAVEVDFPPIASVNARGDGSAKSERLVHEANALAAAALKRALGPRVTLIGCSSGARAALRGACGDAYGLRDGAAAAAGTDGIAICVQPSQEEQWQAAAAIECRCVVVLNGLLNNGALPHAYYYKPMTAFSAQTGGVVRCYPGPYAAFAVGGQRVDIEIGLTTQGARALPDTKQAQMTLQNMFGRR